MNISQNDFKLAIKLIELELGVANFHDYCESIINSSGYKLSNNKVNFFSGQALASALMVVKGITNDLNINDIDIFRFQSYEYSSKTKRSFKSIDFNKHKINYTYRFETSKNDDEIYSLSNDIYLFLLNNAKNKEKMIEMFEQDYYHSSELNSVINSLYSYYNPEIKSNNNASFEINYSEPDKTIIIRKIEYYLKLKFLNHNINKDIRKSNTAIKVISSKTFDKVNVIEFYYKVARSESYFNFLSSFDFNMVQVGYDLKTKKGYYTKEFLNFINSKNFRITNLQGSAHTTVRYFKKINEFKHFKNFHFNKELDLQILGQVSKLKDEKYVNNLSELSSSIIVPVFGEIYFNKINDDFLSNFNLKNITIGKNKNLYEIDDKTIDPVEFIDNGSHLLNLNLSNKNKIYYPSYLRSNLPEIVYTSFYSSKKEKTFYFSEHSISNTFNDYKNNKTLININKTKVLVLNKLNNVKRSNESMDHLVSELSKYYSSEYDFLSNFLNFSNNNAYLTDYKIILDIFTRITKTKDLSFFGYLEDRNYVKLLNLLSSSNYKKDLTKISFLNEFDKKLFLIYKSYNQFSEKEYALTNIDKFFNIDDYTFEYIYSYKRLKEEGNELSHCVGGRFDSLRRKSNLYFSLKSKTDHTQRVTFDINKINEKFVLNEYRSYRNINKKLNKKTYEASLKYFEYLSTKLNFDLNIEKFKMKFQSKLII